MELFFNKLLRRIFIYYHSILSLFGIPVVTSVRNEETTLFWTNKWLDGTSLAQLASELSLLEGY
jgi:hypothetical protein